MFEIYETERNGFTELVIENRQNGECMSVVPQFGARINSLKLKNGPRLYNLIDGYSAAEKLKKDTKFKSAKLTPFPNRIEDGLYTFENQLYQLPINYIEENHACHGFIFNKPFSVIKKNIYESRAVVTLQHQYTGALKGYPFPFEINISYQLEEENGLTVTTKIENCSSQTMPVADGWHPYFTLNGSIDHLQLKVENGKEIELNKRMIPTGNVSESSAFNGFESLSGKKMDHCFAVKPLNGDARFVTELHDPTARVTLQLWQETGPEKYNFLQIFTPKDRNSIAIEPMSANINAFNNQQGLVSLKPGAFFKGQYGVTLTDSKEK